VAVRGDEDNVETDAFTIVVFAPAIGACAFPLVIDGIFGYTALNTK